MTVSHDDRVRHGCAGTRIHLVEQLGHHSVAGHSEQDAGLPVDHDQGDAEDRDHRTGGQQVSLARSTRRRPPGSRRDRPPGPQTG